MTRIFVYILFYMVGYDVWILPNFLADYKPFKEYFNPIIGYYPREDSWGEVIFRVSMAALFLAISIYSYLYPDTLVWCLETISYVHKESLEWGYNKMTAYHVIIKNIK